MVHVSHMLCVVCIVLFFFFKQKTAYEMRISDWSSDVCSSDLAAGTQLTDAVNVSQLTGVTDALGGGAGINPDGSIKAPSYSVAGGTQANVGDALNALDAATAAIGDAAVQYDDPLTKDSVMLAGPRPHEHTPDLPSQMRSSYAVFRLKHKSYTHST